MLRVRTRSPALNFAGAGAGRSKLPRDRIFGASAAVSVRFTGLAGWSDVAGGKLVVADEAELHAQILEAELPFLVVAAAEIDMRRQRLAGEPADVDVPQAEIAHGAVHGENAAFPRRVEHRLVRLGLDLAEAVHAAHVVDAVHGAAPLGASGVRARPVPIMASRVTRVASLSSLQPSVPAGRIGTTR